MGRLIIRGDDALPFLQYVLSNNAAALDPGRAQYTLQPTATGEAVDDAYLYRFTGDEYLLVVNAANRLKDLEHFRQFRKNFPHLEIQDQTDALGMVSLQGPESQRVLLGLITQGELPQPKRNSLSIVTIKGMEVWLTRTGYSGEPFCFELFVGASQLPALWELLQAAGATPVGLGARDTLRLEAGLPLYGHELGLDTEGREIPIFSCPAAHHAVSLAPEKGDFIGRGPLQQQYLAYQLMREGDYTQLEALPRLLRCVVITGQGIARAGAQVYAEGRPAGWVTSGTMAPYWIFTEEGNHSIIIERHELRSICLALLDSAVQVGELLTVAARGRELPAVVVPRHLDNKTPPYARPVVHSG
jgi:aminomethyltransferase